MRVPGADLALARTEEPKRAVYDHRSAPVMGSHDWASHEITAHVPPGAIYIEFGVTLNGRGQVGMRHVELSA